MRGRPSVSVMDNLHILGWSFDIGRNSFIGLTFLDLGDTMDELKIVKSFGSPSIIILSIHRTSNLLVSINGSLLWTYTLLLKIYILIPISISFLYFNNNFTILSIHISLFSLSSLSSLVPQGSQYRTGSHFNLIKKMKYFVTG